MGTRTVSKFGTCNGNVVACRSGAAWCLLAVVLQCQQKCVEERIKPVRSGLRSALLRSAREAGPFSPEAVGSASLDVFPPPHSSPVAPELNQPCLEWGLHEVTPEGPSARTVVCRTEQVISFLGTETAVYYNYLVSTIGLLA